MGTLKEEVLKLPREEKIDLIYALKQDVGWDDDAEEEEELSPEDWAELKRREKMDDNGEMKWISTEEFDNFLKERRNAIQSNKG
jgi:hypothetical protein